MSQVAVAFSASAISSRPAPLRRRAGHRHIKAERRMGGNYLADAQADAVNAGLAAAGYNFSLLLR